MYDKDFNPIELCEGKMEGVMKSNGEYFRWSYWQCSHCHKRFCEFPVMHFRPAESLPKEP